MQILNEGEYTGEIIQKMSIDNIVITNTMYSEKISNPDWHYHENLHICFVFQGGKAETLHSTKYTERGGSIFFYHAEEKHRWVSPQPVSKSANIEICGDFIKSYDLSELKIKKAIEKKIDAKTIILKIQKEMLMDDGNSYLSIQSLLLELFSNSGINSIKNIPKWVICLKELLHDNWNQELSLPELAKITQVHPVTISKFFRKYFSCTLGEYRRKLKIEKSIDLIKDSEKSLSEIAYLCGFSDQSHFTRTFKERTGFLPKYFRNY